MDKREYKNMWVRIEHTEGKVSFGGAGAVLRDPEAVRSGREIS